MSYQHISLGYLDTIVAGDTALRRTLLEMVHQELSNAIPEMKAAYGMRKWETLHGIVHKLKSTLAYVGNENLTITNQQLLTLLEQKNFKADLLPLLRKYEQLLPAVDSELRMELEQSP